MKKRVLVAVLTASLACAAMAQETEGRGPVTNLPMPRFVSLKASEANVRRGPSLSHRVDWVYSLRGLPLRVTAEYGHWRRIEDRDGQGGWIHYSLLSGARTALIEAESVELRSRPDVDSNVVAVAKRGVVARIETCGETWCRIAKDGYEGWVHEDALWGVEPGEIIE
ncbi:aspartyl-trna synthetase [Palleronia caenipelagi]|uniref:Aspartyl-trna synthetase n=2 Tax=Palleronia caenipelagi TaxID=2489174 RepID=A0A547PLR4_9RHOB|nr:SH3 domain-containing protein [Palleronia caenipelagi]TRD15082.1 aspartyl-trna synthetase [Palleronia caenipelagi]